MASRHSKIFVSVFSLALIATFYFFKPVHQTDSASVIREVAAVPGLRCENFLDSQDSSRKIFSPIGLQKFRSSTGRVMVYDFKPPRKGQPTMLLIHGLGDDISSLQRIAERAEKDGFAILRVDLHAHGETLNEYLRTHNQTLPKQFDYRDNVDDIKSLVHSLGLTHIHIVGHSYGGGISLKLAEELPKDVVSSVHVMAPYVERIDKFISEKMSTPDFLISAAEAGVGQIGVPVVTNIFDPFVKLTWQMTRSFRYARDLSNAWLGLDRIKDLIMDPIMQKFLETTYRRYFLKLMNKTPAQLTTEEKNLLEARVESTILTTKGIRGLDYLDTTVPLGTFPSIVQVIGGKNDRLVVPDQLIQFSLRLKQASVPHDLIFLEGPDATHMFPQTMPDQVYDAILESITRPP
jgi:pimeloyl-ACP methyl ester carboxylesterase